MFNAELLVQLLSVDTRVDTCVLRALPQPVAPALPALSHLPGARIFHHALDRLAHLGLLSRRRARSAYTCRVHLHMLWPPERAAVGGSSGASPGGNVPWVPRAEAVNLPRW